VYLYVTESVCVCVSVCVAKLSNGRSYADDPTQKSRNMKLRRFCWNQRLSERIYDGQ